MPRPPSTASEPSAAPSASDELRSRSCGSRGSCDARRGPRGHGGGSGRRRPAVVQIAGLVCAGHCWCWRCRCCRCCGGCGSGPCGWAAHGRSEADAAAHTLAAWQELTDTAWDFGILPDESADPAQGGGPDRAARATSMPRRAEAVHRVAAAVEQVLYAPRPRPTAGLAEDVCRSGRPPGRRAGAARLRALLAPRSAVQSPGRRRPLGDAGGSRGAHGVPLRRPRSGTRREQSGGCRTASRACAAGRGTAGPHRRRQCPPREVTAPPVDGRSGPAHAPGAPHRRTGLWDPSTGGPGCDAGADLTGAARATAYSGPHSVGRDRRPCKADAQRFGPPVRARREVSAQPGLAPWQGVRRAASHAHTWRDGLRGRARGASALRGATHACGCAAGGTRSRA